MRRIGFSETKIAAERWQAQVEEFAVRQHFVGHSPEFGDLRDKCVVGQVRNWRAKRREMWSVATGHDEKRWLDAVALERARCLVGHDRSQTVAEEGNRSIEQRFKRATRTTHEFIERTRLGRSEIALATGWHRGADLDLRKRLRPRPINGGAATRVWKTNQTQARRRERDEASDSAQAGFGVVGVDFPARAAAICSL